MSEYDGTDDDNVHTWIRRVDRVNSTFVKVYDINDKKCDLLASSWTQVAQFRS